MAILNFIGTNIAVYGSQGSIDVDGQPTTFYALDGAVVGNYTSPTIAPGVFTTGIIFFQSQDLANRSHTLIITMTNGTQPNRYLLDYFSYTGSPFVSKLLSSIPSSSDTLSSTAMLSSTTSTVPISSQSPLAAHNSSSRARVGLIVGGVLGGVALLLGATLLVVMLKRRENRRKYLLLQDAHLLGATPFPALQQENRAPYAGARESKHPTHTQTIHPSSSSSSPRLKCHVTSPLVSIPQTDPSTYVSSGPVISEIPNVARPNLSTGSRSVQNHHLPGEGEELKNSPRATVPREEATTSSEMAPSSNPVMRHHSDSEIRLPPAVVDVPPAYSEE